MTNEELDAALRLADEAERVAAKATPEGWGVSQKDAPQWMKDFLGASHFGLREDARYLTGPAIVGDGTPRCPEVFGSTVLAGYVGDEDLELIAHVRNHLPEFISTVRGLVERVKTLESEASANSVLLTAARCSYKIASAERDFLSGHIDFAAAGWKSFHMDGVGDLEPVTNYETYTLEWKLPDGRRARSILEAFRMTRGKKPEESTNA